MRIIYTIEPDPNTIYYLYNSLLHFYQNGGDHAYIVSVGAYGPSSGVPIKPGDQIVNPNVLASDLENGLYVLRKIEEVTMYIFPEATLLSTEENGKLMESTLSQCDYLKTAIGIFDVKGGRAPDAKLGLMIFSGLEIQQEIIF